MHRVLGSDLNAMMNLQLLTQLNIYKNWTITIRIYHVQGKSLWEKFRFTLFFIVDGNSNEWCIGDCVVCVTAKRCSVYVRYIIIEINFWRRESITSSVDNVFKKKLRDNNNGNFFSRIIKIVQVKLSMNSLLLEVNRRNNRGQCLLFADVRVINCVQSCSSWHNDNTQYSMIILGKTLRGCCNFISFSIQLLSWM